KATANWIAATKAKTKPDCPILCSTKRYSQQKMVVDVADVILAESMEVDSIDVMLGQISAKDDSANMDVEEIKEICEDCATGKITQSPIYATSSPATRNLGRIHTDCVPLPKESFPQRHLHGTIIVDSWSRFTVMYTHRLKSESENILKSTISTWEEQQSPLKVGAIRHAGGELRNSFKDFCNTRTPRIADETSPLYNKEYNGMVERHYGVHKGNAITLLAQAKLPLRFTCYALQYSMYVKNCMNHPDETHTSPYELWYGREPDLSRIQPFGCKVTIWTHPDQRKSFYSEKGSEGIFLGYNGNSLYWVYQDNRVKLKSVSHVAFHATSFPGNSTTQEESESETDAEVTRDVDNSTPRYELRSQAAPAVPDLVIPEETGETQTWGPEEPPSGPLEEVLLTGDYPDEPNDLPSSDEESSFSDLESEYSDIQPDQYLVPERVTPESNGYMSEEETPTPVYLSVQTKEKLDEWGIKNIVISKVVAKRQPTRKRVHTLPTSPTEELVDKYPNPKDIPPRGSISTISLPEPPKSRKAMLLHPYSEYFLAAEKVELNAMNRKKVWRKGKHVKGRKLLRPKWIYSYKVDLDTKT
ncbi:hypothetical protein CcCBS67573_g10707, partial [Chytriomyces confervae]